MGNHPFPGYADGMTSAPERWLIAAWPGLGQVATTAAIYLLSRMHMRQMAEFPGRGIFEVENVDIHAGLVRPAQLPRSRLFLWSDPRGVRDLVVFLGEAQPATGKLALCERLMTEGRTLGVSRFFTFSAIATSMLPNTPPRAFGIATDVFSLAELRRREIAILTEGSISGLNGIALAAAAEAGIPAMGLLGEIPAIAADLPCPYASAAVLKTFLAMAGLELDLTELDEYGRSMQERLTSLYDEIMRTLQAPAPPPQAPRERMLGDEDAERIENLFRQAKFDRSKAFELKKELARLGVFARYEDRFLDLFEPGA